MVQHGRAVVRALSGGALTMLLALTGILTAMSALGLLLPLRSLSATTVTHAKYDAVLLHEGDICGIPQLCASSVVTRVGSAAMVMAQPSPAGAGDSEGPVVRIDVVTSSELSTDVLLPEEGLVRRKDVGGSRWVDLTSATARALGVSAGDTVNVPVDGRPNLLTVRREVLADVPGEEYYAVADIKGVTLPAAASVPYFHYVTSTDLGRLRDLVAHAPAEASMGMETKADRDLAMASAERTAMLVLTVVSALAILAGTVVTAVEGHRYGSRQASVVLLLEALGVRRRVGVGVAVAVCSVLTLGAAGVAWALNVFWIHHTWLTPGMPVRVTALFAGALLIATALAALGCWFGLSMRKEPR